MRNFKKINKVPFKLQRRINTLSFSHETYGVSDQIIKIMYILIRVLLQYFIVNVPVVLYASQNKNELSNKTSRDQKGRPVQLYIGLINSVLTVCTHVVQTDLAFCGAVLFLNATIR